jgi:hypothetical protein
VADRGSRGCRVGGQLDALALHAAEHRVDEPVPRARLGQLDGLADRSVRGDSVEEHELEEPELERCAHARLEVAIDVGGDDVVERQAPLDGAEGQLLGEPAVARLEVARLAVQRAVGVGAVGERAQHDGVRGAASGAEGGERHRASTVVGTARMLRAARPPGAPLTSSPPSCRTSGVVVAGLFQSRDHPKGRPPVSVRTPPSKAP